MFIRVIFLSLILVITAFAQLQKTSLQLMWHDQFQFAGFYLAKEKGYYEEVGLDVELKKFTINSNILKIVMDKEADFGVSSSSLLMAKKLGYDIKLVGTVFQSSPLAIMGLKGSNLETLKDIENKKIMISGDKNRIGTFNTMFKSQGIDTDKLNYIKHSYNINDLINKNTDLMIAYTTNEPFRLKEKGYEPIIFHPKDYGFDFYEEIIFTSKSFADKNPQLVKNFYEASMRGWQEAFDNIEQTAQFIYENYNPRNKTLKSLIFEGKEMKKLAFTKEGELGVIKKEKLQLIEHSYRIMGFINSYHNMDELIFDVTAHSFSKEEVEYLNQKEEITMCIDPDWMPFEKNDKGNHIGMSADYIKLLEQEIKVPIRMIPTNTWTQSLELGKQRGCDIFSLVMPTPERLEYLNFSKPYLEIPLVIATNNDALFISSLNQVKKEKIGIVKGYAYGEILRTKNPEMNFIDVKNLTDGLNRVNSGELFGFIGTLATVGYQIQNNYIGQLKIAGKFDEKWELGIGTRNDEPLLNSIFNKAIKKISTEDHQTILNKWISINYQQGVQYATLWRYIIMFAIIIFLLIILYRQYLLNDHNKKLNEQVKLEVEKNTQQQELMAQQAKMAAMGEMIGNIAHQWRQPLSAISTAATSLRVHHEIGTLKEENLLSAADAINDSAQYLSGTIEDFRNFFNQDKEKVLVDLEALLDKSLKLTSSQFVTHEIKVITHIEDIKIKAYENELMQVFINILNNSRDALLSQKENRCIFIHVMSNKDATIIQFKDNAGGIPEQIINRIFEPYFTTKHKSQGTGIGLFMAEEIIVKHMKGKIVATNVNFNHNNQLYYGAQFTIELPHEKS